MSLKLGFSQNERALIHADRCNGAEICEIPVHAWIGGKMMNLEQISDYVKAVIAVTNLCQKVLDLSWDR